MMSLLLKDLLSIAAVILCVEAARQGGPPSKSPRMTMLYTPTLDNNDENAGRLSAKVWEVHRRFAQVCLAHRDPALPAIRLNEALISLCAQLSNFAPDGPHQCVTLAETLAALSDYAGAPCMGGMAVQPNCAELIESLEPDGSPRQIILWSLAAGPDSAREGFVGRAFVRLHPLSQSVLHVGDLIAALRQLATGVN